MFARTDVPIKRAFGDKVGGRERVYEVSLAHGRVHDAENKGRAGITQRPQRRPAGAFAGIANVAVWVSGQCAGIGGEPARCNNKLVNSRLDSVFFCCLRWRKPAA
jgi:hypothetical protein